MPERSADARYLDYVDLARVPDQSDYMVETHRPTKFRVAYHNHASVEVNFLDGCEMEYSFSGSAIRIPQGRMTVFWGAVPHSVTDVFGNGRIINIYISFARLLQWGLPADFVDPLLGGEILCCAEESSLDRELFRRWVDDSARDEPGWHQLVLSEIETRFRRMALERRDVLGAGAGVEGRGNLVVSGTMVHHISKMLRFMADQYAAPISIADVAGHVGISPNHAMSQFRRVVGVPIKVHLTRVRLSHAQMMLANSEKKVVSIAMDSGFGSLSSFYDAFHMHIGSTPAEFRKEARR